MLTKTIGRKIFPARETSNVAGLSALWYAPEVLKVVSVGPWEKQVRIALVYSILRFRVPRPEPLPKNRVGKFEFDAVPKDVLQQIKKANLLAVDDLRHNNWDQPAKGIWNYFDRAASAYLKTVMTAAIDRLLAHIGHMEIKMRWAKVQSS